jgi:DNA-binding transcriptional ArsR family regulator
VVTLTGGRTVRSVLPPCDTPGVAPANPRSRDSLPRARAEAAWRAITPLIAGTPHVRVSRDGGRTYPARHARLLPADPPGQPCTVPVYDPASGTGRMLALDLDPARGDVDHQAAELVQLLEHHGARVLADVSPSGGRHLFVLFSAALPWRELRDAARALSQRHPVVDPAPMSSLGGQISPPGARHKSGGWRLLSMPLADATTAAGHPNGPEVWDALLTEFAAELQQIGTVSQADSSAELDRTGVPWVPRLGGRAPLAAELEHTARTGRWDRSRYAGRSEARMAVLSAAAARGWRLADVRSAISSEAWSGLAVLYERRSERGRLDRLLPLEWQRAIGFVAGEKNLRGRPTSDLQISRPPVPEPVLAAEYGLIRQWLTCVLVALEDPDRVRRWGGRVIAVRLVLLALGQAAMVSGSSVVEFGCRNLSLHSALSHRTVARVLELLRDEPDPLLDLVSRRSAARADRYQLRIPACYADSARWRRRHAGRVDAAHPAFLVLGGTAALAYQVLDSAEARGAEVARSARLSPSATSAALRVLAEHGLAERGQHGWRRGPAVLDDVAESTGAADIHRERAERYQEDRASWRARLRQYVGARSALVAPGDGWLGLDDEDDWSAMLASRWPVLGGDFVRGPPGAARETA